MPIGSGSGFMCTHRLVTLIVISFLSVLSLLVYASGHNSGVTAWKQKLPTRGYDQHLLSSSSLLGGLLNVEKAKQSAAQTCAIDDKYAETYGQANLRLSRVHEGSRYRLAQVINRAKNGHKIKVGVLGGSVSTGHGFADGRPFRYGAIKRIWWHTVRDGLERLIGKDNFEFVDGAKPAVNSGYFSWCYPVALGGADADLVFVESAVNDVYSTQSLSDAEDLLRSLLQLPSQPAVIYVDSFALRTESGRDGMLNGGDAHAALASFYDVPQISVRGPSLPAMLRDKTLMEPYFKTDVRHIAQPLHDYLGDMVTAFLEETACQADAILADAAKTQAAADSRDQVGTDSSRLGVSDWSTTTARWLGSVPRLKISDPWNSAKTYPGPGSIPTCLLADHGLRPSAPSPGWTVWSWKDTKHYLVASTPAARVQFRIKVEPGAQGMIALSYLRSKKYDLGRVKCGVRDVEDNREQRNGATENELEDQGASQVSDALLGEATFDGFWERGVSIPQEGIIATGLTPGREYEVTCRTPKRGFRGKEFRIMGLLSR